MAMFHDLDLREPLWQRALRLMLIAGAHALVIAALLTVGFEPRVIETADTLEVRLLEQAPAPLESRPDQVEPPPQPRPVLRRAVSRPAPVLTAAPDVPASTASFTASPQPLPSPEAALEPAAASVPPALTAARFDAAYLHNPAPEYPALSRRLGEQGKTVLLVRVTPEGTAASVEVKTGSGYPRLDEAALEAVRLWRFVPARRGEEAIASAVLVPIAFRLDR